MLAAGCASSGQTSGGASAAGGASNAGEDSLIEPEALARRFHEARPDEREGLILDVRTAEAYAAGHVAGAVHVDVTKWKDASLREESGLEHEVFWRRRIGELGVTGREPVYVYDDGRMTEAARVWFIFQHFNVPRVAVVNGGYRALEPLMRDGRMPMSRERAVPKAASFEPDPAAQGAVALVDRQRLRELVDSSAVQVFDSRTRDEFTGKEMQHNPRGGHIPSAINLTHKQLLDAQGRLKTPSALAGLFERAGFVRGRPIVTHCQSGGRASLAALAAQRAGYGPIFNYYLSFGDWSADASCPIETGE
jgi:thiosulfate/3-mercaptopyruvate sulfurtransferase